MISINLPNWARKSSSDLVSCYIGLLQGSVILWTQTKCWPFLWFVCNFIMCKFVYFFVDFLEGVNLTNCFSWPVDRVGYMVLHTCQNSLISHSWSDYLSRLTSGYGETLIDMQHFLLLISLSGRYDLKSLTFYNPGLQYYGLLIVRSGSSGVSYI